LHSHSIQRVRHKKDFITVLDTNKNSLNNLQILIVLIGDYRKEYARMDEFSNEAYFLLFSTLANRTRLAIIDTLKDGPKSISQISASLQQKTDLISENLKPLEKCVLITSKIRGNEKIYSLNREIMEPLSHALANHTAKHCPGLRECIPKEKLRDYMKKEAAKATFIKHE